MCAGDSLPDVVAAITTCPRHGSGAKLRNMDVTTEQLAVAHKIGDVKFCPLISCDYVSWADRDYASPTYRFSVQTALRVKAFMLKFSEQYVGDGR